MLGARRRRGLSSRSMIERAAVGHRFRKGAIGSGRLAIPAWGALLCSLASCAGKQPASRTPAAAAAVAAKPAGPEAGPPVTLLPAMTARPLQLVSVSIGSFDRLLDSGVRLASQAVPLPLTASGLRDMLISQAGLPPEVATEVDLGSPTGAVVVALDDKGATGVVLAIPARGPAEAEKLIDALGKRVMTRGPITLVNNGTKSHGWVFRAGNVVVLSDEMEGLTRGAMLALEARRAGPDDVTTTIYPESIARAHGTDVKTAIGALIDQARAVQQANNPSGVDMGDGYFYETAAKMMALIGDADRVEVGLSIDPARGLTLLGRLFARPGTALEATAKQVTPFEIDPAVLGGTGPRFGVGAMSLGSLWQDILGHYRQRLAGDKAKGVAAALAYYDAFLAGQSGQQTGAVWLQKEMPYFSGAFSTSLKSAATAAKVGAALGRMDAPAISALMRAQMGSSASLLEMTSKRETVGKVKALHVRMTLKKGLLADTWKRIFGGGLDVYQGLVGTRIVGTFGRDARARLLALASGKTPAAETAGPFAEARTAAKGRDAFYYADLSPILGLLGVFSSDPRAAALAKMGSGPVPFVCTAGGDGVGKIWSMDLVLPVVAFKSVGALIAAGMGAGGGE
jgi:hypothetical protein